MKMKFSSDKIYYNFFQENPKITNMKKLPQMLNIPASRCSMLFLSKHWNIWPFGFGRFQKQMEEEEQAFQQQRRRLYAEIQEEKERLAAQAQKQRKELDELKEKLEVCKTHTNVVCSTRTATFAAHQIIIALFSF